jgi:hypothetical protein
LLAGERGHAISPGFGTKEVGQNCRERNAPAVGREDLCLI